MWQEDVCTRCLYTICRGLSAQHRVGVSLVSIGRHPNSGTEPPLGQTQRLKIGILTKSLPAFNCSEEVFAMDILAESGEDRRGNSHSARAIRSSPSRWLVANRCVVTKTCRKKTKLVCIMLVAFCRNSILLGHYSTTRIVVHCTDVYCTPRGIWYCRRYLVGWD